MVSLNWDVLYLHLGILEFEDLVLKEKKTYLNKFLYLIRCWKDILDALGQIKCIIKIFTCLFLILFPVATGKVKITHVACIYDAYYISVVQCWL